MKSPPLQTNADRWHFKENLSTIIVGALVVTMLAGLVLLVWQKTSQRVDTGDYEGIIVDRFGDYAETNEGSRPRFRLLIETQEGMRFTVRVDPSVYGSAKVGMRIERRSGQIVLIESELKRTGK